jgi:hypothetical protein
VVYISCSGGLIVCVLAGATFHFETPPPESGGKGVID